MKRSAFLIVGLSVLLPYLVGVRRQGDRRSTSTGRRFLGEVVGAIPGFFAETHLASDRRRRCGAGGLSRPLGADAGHVRLAPAAAARAAAGRAAGPVARGEKPEGEAEACGSVKAGGRRAGSRGRRAQAARGNRRKVAGKPDGKPAKAKAGKKPEAATRPRRQGTRTGLGRRAARGARPEAIDAGEAELDVLQERLEETLAEFKVEGDVAGRTTGPVVTQYGVRLRPGRQDESAGRRWPTTSRSR